MKHTDLESGLIEVPASCAGLAGERTRNEHNSLYNHVFIAQQWWIV